MLNKNKNINATLTLFSADHAAQVTRTTVETVPTRTSSASASVAGCRTTLGRHFSSSPASQRWPRFSHPTDAVARRSTLRESVSRAQRWTFSFVSFHLPGGPTEPLDQNRSGFLETPLTNLSLIPPTLFLSLSLSSFQYFTFPLAFTCPLSCSSYIDSLTLKNWILAGWS